MPQPSENDAAAKKLKQMQKQFRSALLDDSPIPRPQGSLRTLDRQAAPSSKPNTENAVTPRVIILPRAYPAPRSVNPGLPNVPDNGASPQLVILPRAWFPNDPTIANQASQNVMELKSVFPSQPALQSDRKSIYD